MKAGSGKRFVCFVLFMVFVGSGIAWSAEYREFRNLAGKAIHACIVQYDAEGGRVQLELKNRKKAWIEISTLSAGDQEYIKQWQQEKTTGKTISEEEVRAIAEQYIKMVWTGEETANYSLWRKLFKDLHGEDKDRFNERYFLRCIVFQRKHGTILEVDGLNVKLSIDGETGWLQLLSDGRIKYDPLSFSHPLVEIGQYVEALFNLTEKYAYREEYAYAYSHSIIDAFATRKRLGAFCFDFDSSLELDRKALARKICDWLVATGGDWDNSEPKLKLPADEFEEIVGRVKEYAYPEAVVRSSQPSKAHKEHLDKWKKKKSDSGTRISSEEAHDIADLYVQAAKGNYALWCDLFSPFYKDDGRLNPGNFERMIRHFQVPEIKQPVSVGAADGLRVEILYKRTVFIWDPIDRDGKSGSSIEGGAPILLLPDGRIKYVSPMFPHPYEEASELLGRMTGHLFHHSEKNDYYQLSAARRLKELGIPLFGFDPSTSNSKQKRSIRKIADWLQDRDPEWDVSEPKVSLPLDQFHGLKKLFGRRY